MNRKLLIGSVVVLAGCAVEPEDGLELEQESVDDVEAVSSGASPDWIGFELGLQPPRSEFIGIAEVSTEGPSFPKRPAATQTVRDAQPEVESPAASGELQWVEVVGETGEMFRHTMPAADAALLRDHLQADGLMNAFGPASVRDSGTAEPAGGEPGSEGLAPVGDLMAEPDVLHTWSDGQDSRSRLAVADGFGVNWWPYRTIGHMGTGFGCTGTIIGRQVILTSAHCVWNGGIVGHTFRPRRDPSDASPHGQATTMNYIMPSPWFTGSWKCGTSDSNFGECFKHDIAIVRLSQPLGDVTGGMGFGHIPSGTISGYKNYLRGYPTCATGQFFSPARPAGCTQNALYGHANSSAHRCKMSQWGAAGCRSDGWYCTVDVSCDASFGQSGSSVYTYDATWAGGNPVSVGVYSLAECIAEDCEDNSYPNGITRITPNISSMLVYWKSQWGG